MIIPKMAVRSALAVLFHIWLVACTDKFLIKDYHPAPGAWRNIGRAPGNHILQLKIGLTQRDFPELERQLYEISDPFHAKYGQYLSSTDIQRLVTPGAETLLAVEEWLHTAGLERSRWEYNTAKTWINVPVTIAEAEALMDTKYSIWLHNDGSELIRTQSWSLPENLHCHITTIQPTNSWARLEPKVPIREIRSTDSHRVPANIPNIPPPPDSAIASLCNFSAVTPDCLRTLYGTASYTTKSNGASRLGWTSYLEEYSNRSDVYQFLSMYRPEAADIAYNFSEISIAGGPVDNATKTASEAYIGLEGNLDAQYMIGIGYPLDVTSWSTGGSQPGFKPSLSTPTNTDEPYLTWINYIQAQGDIPQIISTSYGDDEQTVSLAYAQAVCNEFAQITAQGVTLLFASGDYGVGADGACYANTDNTTYEFLPSFPNSCPFVTNVGGTKGYPEVAANLTFHDGGRFASGAGFSNYFGVPNYQKDTVGKYVAGLNGLYDGYYNKSGTRSCENLIRDRILITHRSSIPGHQLYCTAIPDNMEWHHSLSTRHLRSQSNLCCSSRVR